MKNVVLLAVVAAVLSGCQTKPVAEMSYSELMETSRDIQKRCEEQGAIHPSPEFEICIRQEVRREHATRASNREARAALADAVGGGLSSMGNAYNAAAQVNTYSYSPPITCTSTRTPSGSFTTRC